MARFITLLGVTEKGSSHINKSVERALDFYRLAAGGVMMVIPAYLYNDKGMHDIVLNGYLPINVHICGYLLYKRYRGQPPVASMYVPFVSLSIIWAISIHTVTAFIPGTLHEIVEYRPSLTEWKVTAGIWALGFMIYTLLLMITINLYSRNMRDARGQRTVESKDALAFGEDS